MIEPPGDADQAKGNWMARLARFFQTLIFAAAAAAASITAAAAADLRIGLPSPSTSMDPHFQALVPNSSVLENIFEALIKIDPDSKFGPSLAESWKAVSDTAWEFKIRKGVKFHDGTELTAEDVVYSINRPATITNSPAPYTIYTRTIAESKAIDSHTVQFVTRIPHPTLINDLASVAILSKKASEGVRSEDMATGKGVVGTGPYKFVSYVREERVELVRNDSYWGGKPDWDKVQIRFITSAPSRLAALLAGDVDAIESVPTQDIARVKGDAKFNYAQKVSHRVIYFYIDSGRDQTPMVTAKDGSPLAKNPLKDVRVRRAISSAINREAIRDRIMEGLAYPTGNYVTETLFGNNPDVKMPAFDADGAKKLLAEAGYPDGFGMTIVGPNNRFVNDARIVEAVGQMLSRIGIAAKVDTMPMAPYTTRGPKGEFSFGLIGWGAATGEVSSTLRAIIACANRDKGFGQFNWSNYCNPQVDGLLEKAITTIDDGQRLRLLQDAVKIATDEVAIVPMHFQATSWATKKGIKVIARTDERTLASTFAPE